MLRTIKRLHLALLVAAQHNRIRRRIQAHLIFELLEALQLSNQVRILQKDRGLRSLQSGNSG